MDWAWVFNRTAGFAVSYGCQYAGGNVWISLLKWRVSSVDWAWAFNRTAGFAISVGINVAVEMYGFPE